MTHPLVSCLVGVAIAVAVAAASGAPEGVSIAEVEQALRGSDPKAFVGRLVSRCDEDEGRAVTVCDRIASGHRAWLDLAPRLYEHTDGSTSTAVCHSLGLAMRRAPDAVLALWRKTPGMTEDCICLPFVSNEIPLRQQLAEYRKSRQAVLSARAPALAPARAACLALIEPGLRELQPTRAASAAR